MAMFVSTLRKRIDQLIASGLAPHAVLEDVCAKMDEFIQRDYRERKDRVERVMTTPVPILSRVDAVVGAASRRYNVSKNAIVGYSRSKPLVWPRHVAIWATRRIVHDAALVDIGAMFNRDHSTVLYAIAKVDDMRFKDAAILAQTNEFLAEASNGTAA